MPDERYDDNTFYWENGNVHLALPSTGGRASLWAFLRPISIVRVNYAYHFRLQSRRISRCPRPTSANEVPVVVHRPNCQHCVYQTENDPIQRIHGCIAYRKQRRPPSTTYSRTTRRIRQINPETPSFGKVRGPLAVAQTSKT